MAKQENMRDKESLVDGFSYGASKQAAQEEPAPRTVPVVPAASAAPAVPAVQALTRAYKDSREDRRSVRISFLIKPSTNKRLELAVERGEIKNKNDLVNYLLEQYLGG